MGTVVNFPRKARDPVTLSKRTWLDLIDMQHSALEGGIIGAAIIYVTSDGEHRVRFTGVCDDEIPLRYELAEELSCALDEFSA